jgi:hypothetical protein
MSRRRGWFGRVKRGCYQSNRFCGPIQGVMKTKSKVQMLKAKVHRPEAKVQSPKSKVRSRADRRPAAVERLASFLSVWLILALLATGCAGPRPLKGGKAVTMHKPAGVIEQTLVQGENPSQATKQDQETVKVRSYTVPAGSRMEPSPAPAAPQAQLSTINSQPINLQPSTTRYPRLPAPLKASPQASSRTWDSRPACPAALQDAWGRCNGPPVRSFESFDWWIALECRFDWSPSIRPTPDRPSRLRPRVQ